MTAYSLEQLLAKLFIARPDVRAFQRSDGAYQPDKDAEGNLLGWNTQAIRDHIAGTQTYGHYLLSKESKCKLMAFDIDLNKTGRLPQVPLPSFVEGNTTQYKDSATIAWTSSFLDDNPREAWLNRAHPARDYMKLAMRTLAHVIQRAIEDVSIPTAVTYTGAKGLHVYGFVPIMPAVEIRTITQVVIDSLPLEVATSPVTGKSLGKNFFSWNGANEEAKLFTVEVFPKQDEIDPDGGFGNLMRLPLGKNRKSPDPTFFVDDTVTVNNVLKPVDAHTKLSEVHERLYGNG